MSCLAVAALGEGKRQRVGEGALGHAQRRRRLDAGSAVTTARSTCRERFPIELGVERLGIAGVRVDPKHKMRRRKDEAFEVGWRKGNTE